MGVVHCSVNKLQDIPSPSSFPKKMILPLLTFSQRMKTTYHLLRETMLDFLLCQIFSNWWVTIGHNLIFGGLQAPQWWSWKLKWPGSCFQVALASDPLQWLPHFLVPKSGCKPQVENHSALQPLRWIMRWHNLKIIFRSCIILNATSWLWRAPDPPWTTQKAAKLRSLRTPSLYNTKIMDSISSCLMMFLQI